MKNRTDRGTRQPLDAKISVNSSLRGRLGGILSRGFLLGGSGFRIRFSNYGPADFPARSESAILLAGVRIVALLGRAPILDRFRLGDLAIMIAWGQASALAVEASSVLNGSWVYVPGYWWNPTWMMLGGRPLTVLIQFTWLAASIVFHLRVINRNTHKAGDHALTE
jgi:hypothetical protein